VRIRNLTEHLDGARRDIAKGENCALQVISSDDNCFSQPRVRIRAPARVGRQGLAGKRLKLKIQEKMERLPQVKQFCDRAVLLVCSHVEAASFRASPEQLRLLRLVFSPRELSAVAEERCAQCRCGYVACDRPVQKQQLLGQPLRYDEATGDIADRSLQLHYCSPACFEASRVLEASLEPNPPYLRSDIVATLVRVARELGVGSESVATIERLAQPLLPKPIAIVEEPERAAAIAPIAVVADSEEVDVLGMMDWDEEDRHPQLRTVEVPLVPLLWDSLGQWITSDTRVFVATGELTEAMAGPDTSVTADLQGRSLVQRRTRLSQVLGPVLRDTLRGCEVEDPEEVALLVGRVDHLILSLCVVTGHEVADPAARFDYSGAVNALYGSKGLRLMAAVFLAVLRPGLTKALCEQLPGVKQFELDLLKSLFLA
jgi:hypothetical protein